MITKYALAILLFGAGLVSGMFAQRLLVLSTPAERQTVASAAQRDESARAALLKQPSSTSETRADAPLWQETIEWRKPEAEGDNGQAHSSYASERRPERDEPRQNWTPEMWASNRAAWVERARAERLARMETMRSNLVEQAKLTTNQAVRFDVIVSAMNLRLQQQAETFQKALENGTMTRPEVRARAMKEIGTVMALTYDELDRNMPTRWRAETESDALNLWTFIDSEVWRELRPAMRGHMGRGPAAFRGSSPRTDQQSSGPQQSR